MRRLWVYKCNSRCLPHQRSYGHWSDFFNEPADGEWGNSDGIGNPASRKILLERIGPGDLVLAYQTDLRGAIGLCVVVAIRPNADGHTALYLRALQRFPRPVDILALKRRDPDVARIRAFRQGQVQTLYETSLEEAQLLLRTCGARARLRRLARARPAKEFGQLAARVTTDEALHGGAGFGDPETNARVEKAAVRAVREDFEKRGFEVQSVECEKIGYDLKCVKRGEKVTFYVEVKGVRASQPGFIMTRKEHNNLGCREFRVAVVTDALSRHRRKIHVYSPERFKRLFNCVPVQYHCTLAQQDSVNVARRAT